MKLVQNSSEISVVTDILRAERDRGVKESGYRIKIKGFGCYNHQDISYTVFFQNKKTKEMMIIPSSDKLEFYVLEQLNHAKVDMYYRCSRCPTMRTKHNSISLVLLLLVSVLMLRIFLNALSMFNVLWSSAMIWIIAEMILMYADNVRLDNNFRYLLNTYSIILVDSVRLYYMVFFWWTVYLSAQDNNSYFWLIFLFAFSWTIILYEEFPAFLEEHFRSRTTFIHHLLGVRVAVYRGKYPFNE